MAFRVIVDAPVHGFHRKLAAACSGGPLLDGYLLGIVGIALTGITAQWHLTAATAALVGVAALVGMFFGGLIFGPVTDRIGRKPMYTLDLVALIVASLLSVFVTAAWQLIVLRFVIGVAIAADYPIATSLLSEWLPRRDRGKIFTSVIIIWYIGTALAYFIGYLLTAWLGNGGWRWMLGSSAVLAAIIFLLRLGTPESPRWLVGAGRPDEAREVIEQALDEPVSQTELKEVAAAGEEEPRGSVRELFRGVYLRRTAFVVTFFTCAIIPLFALETFGPRLLGSFGLGTGNLANLGTAVINLVFAIGCLPAMWLLESVGRRTVIVWSFGLMVLPLVALGAWAHAPAPFAIAFFCLYALFSGGPGILEWGYPNELFPTHIRAAAVGMSVALTRFGAAIGTFLVPIALGSLGISATMYAGAVITFIGFVACLAWAEETRNRSLEESGASEPSAAGRVPDRSNA